MVGRVVRPTDRVTPINLCFTLKQLSAAASSCLGVTAIQVARSAGLNAAMNLNPGSSNSAVVPATSSAKPSLSAAASFGVAHTPRRYKMVFSWTLSLMLTVRSLVPRCVFATPRRRSRTPCSVKEPAATAVTASPSGEAIAFGRSPSSKRATRWCWLRLKCRGEGGAVLHPDGPKNLAQLQQMNRGQAN